MSETKRLGLPFLDAGQAAKELTHNEALVRLDIAVQTNVAAVGEEVPPENPVIGAAWIVGAAPTGAWAGRAENIAGWTASGWRFVVPLEGMTAWVEGAGVDARFAGGRWRLGEITGKALIIGGLPVVRARAAGVPDPVDGATIDAEGRAAIGAILDALRHHGLIAT